jgi:hypothetical protein
VHDEINVEHVQLELYSCTSIGSSLVASRVSSK